MFFKKSIVFLFLCIYFVFCDTDDSLQISSEEYQEFNQLYDRDFQNYTEMEDSRYYWSRRSFIIFLHDICMNDTYCKQKYYQLQEIDIDVFSFLFQKTHDLTQYAILEVSNNSQTYYLFDSINPLIKNCINESAIINITTLNNNVWLNDLNAAIFDSKAKCDTNEILQLSPNYKILSCVCLPDRKCLNGIYDQSPLRLGFYLFSIIIVIGIIIGYILLVFWCRTVIKADKLEKTHPEVLHYLY